MNETVIEDMLLHHGHELEEERKYIQSADEKNNIFICIKIKKYFFVVG